MPEQRKAVSSFRHLMHWIYLDDRMGKNIREKILSAYEDMAESYNSIIDHKPHNVYYDRPNNLGLIPEVKGKLVLDAACSPGKYAEMLITQGAEVTGFDISP